MSNIFLVFEGLDASGKTTLSEYLYRDLMSIGKEAVLVKSGYILIDRTIANIKREKYYDKKIHFLLAMANSIITYKSTLEKNVCKIILYDRYYYTTLAYNMALGMDYEWALKVSDIVEKPSKVVFCDSSIDALVNRKSGLYEDTETGFIKSKDSKRNSFIEYQSKVKYFYQKLIENDKERFIILNTENTVEETFQSLKYKLREEGILYG